MPFDKFVDMETLSEERRKGLHQSLRSISLAELNDIAKQHEDEFVGCPWREEFLRLMAETSARWFLPCGSTSRHLSFLLP